MSIIEAVSQRRAVRRAVRTACQIVTDKDFRLLGERAIDVSSRGLLVETDEEVTLGEPVIVALRAPGTRLWLDAEGTVCRFVAGRRRADLGRCVGVKLRGFDRVSKILLTETLRGLPPPVPARAFRRDYARAVAAIAAIATDRS